MFKVKLVLELDEFEGLMMYRDIELPFVPMAGLWLYLSDSVGKSTCFDMVAITKMPDYVLGSSRFVCDCELIGEPNFAQSEIVNELVSRGWSTDEGEDF